MLLIAFQYPDRVAVEAKRDKFLECSSIEADEVRLENTKASRVRADKVLIGPGCHIDVVEYEDEIVISSDAFVKEKIQY